MEMVSLSFRHTPKVKWFGERRVVCMGAETLSRSEQTAIQSEAMREKLKQNIGADYESFEILANRTTKLPQFDAQRDGQYVSLFVSLIAQKNKNPKDSDGLNQFMKSHPPKFLANMPVGNNAINARSNLNYYPGGPHRFMTGNVTDIDVHFFADDDLQIALEKEWENFQKAREEVRTALGGMSNSLSPYLVAHVYLKGNLPPNIRSVIANSPASSSAQSKILQTLHIEPSATKAVEMSQKYTALEEGNVLRMETEVTGLDMPLFLSRYQQVKQEYPELSVENLSTQSQGIQLLEAVRGVPGNSDEFIKSVDTFIKGMQKGEPKTLAQFVILQNALERYDQNQSLNATAEGKLKAEQNGEGKTLANFTGNSIEKMFDLIQNGDNMAKVSSIGILSVLVLGFFGKGPLGEIKMIKNALIGLGLAAAIEKVGTEMNGGLSPFQGIYDALQDNPSGFRQQFLKRNGIENRNNEVLISTLEDVPMKQILEFRENINEQLAKGGKNISYYNAKADLPPEGIRKAIREASRGSGMPYDKEELAKMVYDISGKLMLDIGRNQSETTASKTQGTLIHEGEQYAQEHYKQNTMGNILDIYEGVESIRENLNITQKIRQSFGDGAEWVWKGIQHLDGATRDEALAFLQRTKEQRGGNLWEGVKLLFGKGWELTKDGANWVFVTDINGYSIQNTIWDNGTKIDLKSVLHITGGALQVPLQVMGVTAGGAIAIGEFLAKHGDDQTVIKLFSEGWANTKWFFDSLMGTGVYENPIDIPASGAVPDNFYLNDVFGQYGDEVHFSMTANTPEKYYYDSSEQAYFSTAVVPMTLTADEQKNPELSGSDAQMLHWREQALKVAQENMEKGIASRASRPLPYTKEWNQDLSRYIVGTTIVEEGGTKKMMVALRVPTQLEKESAGERKTLDFVVSEQLKTFLNTKYEFTSPGASQSRVLTVRAFLQEQEDSIENTFWKQAVDFADHNILVSGTLGATAGGAIAGIPGGVIGAILGVVNGVPGYSSVPREDSFREGYDSFEEVIAKNSIEFLKNPNATLGQPASAPQSPSPSIPITAGMSPFSLNPFPAPSPLPPPQTFYEAFERYFREKKYTLTPHS